MKLTSESIRAIFQKPAAKHLAIGLLLAVGISLIALWCREPSQPAWKRFLSTGITAAKSAATVDWQRAGASAAGMEGMSESELTMRHAQSSLAGAVAECQHLQRTFGRNSQEVLTSIRRLERLCESLIQQGLQPADLEMILSRLNLASANKPQRPADAAITRDELNRMLAGSQRN